MSDSILKLETFHWLCVYMVAQLHWHTETEVSNTRPAGRMWPAMLFGNFQIINIYVAIVAWKRCQNNWTKAEWYPVRFSSRP